MVDVQRLAQLAYAAAAAAVRSERVCRSGHWPAIRRTQAAGQHEVGRLHGPSHGCSYRGRETAIVPAAEMPSDSSEQRRHHPFSDNSLGTVSPADSRKQRSCAAQERRTRRGLGLWAARGAAGRANARLCVRCGCGIYRLPAAIVVRAGVPVSGVRPLSLKLVHRLPRVLRQRTRVGLDVT